MQKYLIALAGIVILLSACNSNLGAGTTHLESQRLDNCSFQSAIWQLDSNNRIYADASAHCYVVRDGIDELRFVTSTQRFANNTWVTVSADRLPSKKTLPAGQQAGYIDQQHQKSSYVACEAGRYRPRMTVISYINGTETKGKTITHYGPEKEISFIDCVY